MAVSGDMAASGQAGAAQGAAAGAQFGPAGMIIGGIAGGISGTASGYFNSRGAKKKQRAYDQAMAIEAARQRALQEKFAALQAQRNQETTATLSADNAAWERSIATRDSGDQAAENIRATEAAGMMDAQEQMDGANTPAAAGGGLEAQHARRYAARARRRAVQAQAPLEYEEALNRQRSRDGGHGREYELQNAGFRDRLGATGMRARADMADWKSQVDGNQSQFRMDMRSAAGEGEGHLRTGRAISGVTSMVANGVQSFGAQK